MALDSVDFQVSDGITGLLGPNGAGKSTAIKLSLGLIRPTSGSVEVMGRRPYDPDLPECQPSTPTPTSGPTPCPWHPIHCTGRPTNTPRPTNTAVPTYTNTPEPTATRTTVPTKTKSPTATPIPTVAATSTPVLVRPTNTPIPVATSTPNPDPRVANEYTNSKAGRPQADQ